MQERSINTSGANHDDLAGAARAEQHYDLVVRPGGGGGGGDEPPCDCAGPPPPRFLLPPPPVDPSWATADEDVCDIVAPYQVCQGHTGVTAGENLHGQPSLSMLAALITTSLFLFIVLVAGTVFFCRHRRRLSSIMSSKGTGKRSETSRMLYDDLTLRPHVMSSNLRPNGPHIEMVAVKADQCPPQLMPGMPAGAGTLFVYPPPPSLTDDGSERLSNMYEEIPYYGRPVPSVSYGSDSDEDVLSRPSEEELRVSGGPPRPCYLPTPLGEYDREPRYVHTMPPGAAVGVPRSGGQPQPRTSDRRRHSPSSPAARPGIRRDASLRRKDPYYYSDILARDAADVTGNGGDVTGAGQYREPYDERRPGSRSSRRYCQPDVAAGDLRSPSGRPRDGHVTPLANRIALDPFVDVYGGGRSGAHRPRQKLSSFRSPSDQGGTCEDGYVNSAGGFVGPPGRGVTVNGAGGDELARGHPGAQWSHND